MAHIITAKYVDGQPPYRLCEIFKRYGVELPRKTLYESVLKTAALLEAFIEHLQTQLSSGSPIYMDETMDETDPTLCCQPEKSAVQ